MFGIGGFELFIILIFGFLIFGPDKLPEIAKTVGRGIARFREAQQEVNEAIGDEKLIDLNNPDQPFKDPMEALDRIAKRQEEKRAAAEASANAKAGAASPEAADSPKDADDAVSAGAEAPEEPKQESFTERKARYERERAARKAAEAAEAEAAKDAAADARETPAPEAEGADVPAGGGDA